MIKANEIRVGNLLEWNKKPFKVCAIFRNVTENEFWAKDNSELHPIPLTEEILLKCGYIKEQYAYYDKFNQIYLSITGEWHFAPFCTNDADSLIKIKYLHQLQNLYFALTGQELEINL